MNVYVLVVARNINKLDPPTSDLTLQVKHVFNRTFWDGDGARTFLCVGV